MKDGDRPTFIQEGETDRANRVDLTVYRLERFSDTKNAWIFVKRRAKVALPLDNDRPSFLEFDKVEEANGVDMNIYRFECFSEVRGTWMFVKRRII